MYLILIAFSSIKLHIPACWSVKRKNTFAYLFKKKSENFLSTMNFLVAS